MGLEIEMEHLTLEIPYGQESDAQLNRIIELAATWKWECYCLKDYPKFGYCSLTFIRSKMTGGFSD